MPSALLAVLLTLAQPAAPSSIYRDDELSLIVRTQELKAPRIERVLELMELEPGMTALDIGAGSGQQARALARRLPKGRVYAADIDARLMAYVAEEARRAGLSNLETLVVSTGVDPLYGGRRYDRILMYDVYNYLTDRPSYYERLRPLLAPGGRLVLVESDQSRDRSFHEEDVADWDRLLAAIRAEPAGGPFGTHLRAPLEGTPPAALRRMALFHLNRALEWPFYLSFTRGLEFALDPGFDATEAPYARWLLHRLALSRAAERDFMLLEYQLYSLTQALNKLILIARYRPYLRTGGIHPYWSRAPEVAWYLEHPHRQREMSAAGYRLVRKVPLPPFQAVWLYEAAR